MVPPENQTFITPEARLIFACIDRCFVTRMQVMRASRIHWTGALLKSGDVNSDFCLA